MDARLVKFWFCMVISSSFLFGCGHIFAPNRAPGGSHQRIEWHPDQRLADCGNGDELVEQLSHPAKFVIAGLKTHTLRVDIERQPTKTIRLTIELNNDGGSLIDRIDQTLGGHMSCPRIIHLAASLASTMVEQWGTVQEPGEVDFPRSASPGSAKEFAAPPIKRDVERLRPPSPPQQPLEQRDEYAPPPHPSTVAPPSPRELPRTQVPVDVVVNVKQNNGDKPKEPSKRYFFAGVGLLRGQDPNLNAGARIGVGYDLASFFALEADLSAVGAVVDITDGEAFKTQSYAMMVNVALCATSKPLGFCLMGSFMHDGFVAVESARPKRTQGLELGAGLGAGVRTWYEIPLGSSLGLRTNIDMTIPIGLINGDIDDVRVWKKITPVGTAMLTLLYRW